MLETISASITPAQQRKAERQLAAAQRRAQQLADFKAEIRKAWDDKLAQLYTNPTLNLQEKLSDGLNDRTLWLIFAIVENAERCSVQGQQRSAECKWYDSIAPRALKKGETYESGWRSRGVSGFTARYARTVERFLRPSRNGYVYPTDEGIELVMTLRQNHPHLAPDIDTVYTALPVPVLGMTLPDTRWRAWR